VPRACCCRFVGHYFRRIILVSASCLGVFFLAWGGSASSSMASTIWLEAEQFDNTGGWSNDCQFVDLMGSPYLLATGLGKAVDDAFTGARIDKPGAYRLWVRCKDWLCDYSPGRFQVQVGDKVSAVTFGQAESDAWRWVDGGTFDLQAGPIEVRLHDLTGWWGRCDAIVLTDDEFKPAEDLDVLARQREKYLGVSRTPKRMGPYDVVIVGGGLAGCGAAVSAGRHGCSVALIQDRPVLGGNSSSEIEVPVMGYCTWWEFNKYDPGVTGVIEEFYPEIGQTGRSKEIEAILRNEKNISLFLNTRATGVEMHTDDRIRSVLALNVRTGERLCFMASLFIDCTGHGWVGYYAGAEYRQGQEARSEFDESLAPEKPGKRTMGNDLYKAEFVTRDKPVAFGCPDWAYQWTKADDFEPRDSHPRIEDVHRPASFDQPSRGKGRQPEPDDINGGTHHKWWVEYGGMLDTVWAAEKIRDELFRINIGLWNYAKNHNPKTREKNKRREMVWLNYVSGVRESRRLIGDYIMSQREYDAQIIHKDTVAFTDWGIDVHHPEGFWVRGNDCIHVYGNRRVSIPYRCLYSRNIENLFMAGRCISVTHIALGGTRIMRTVCMTGQAAGTAAALAKKYNTTPRGIYKKHMRQLQQIMLKDGCHLVGIANRDPADLALRATATASSYEKGLGPENVNNGWSRVVADKRNAWVPNPNARPPHWVQLEIPEASVVNTVHVSFPKRSDRATDFAVETWVDGSWKQAVAVVGNEMRRRVISFEPVKTNRIRLVISEAVGRFGICEIRLYNESRKDCQL